MSDPLLSLTGALVKRRGKTILGPVDLTFGAAGFTIVLGPNGAGKTTLLKVLHGVERLSAGEVHGAGAAQGRRIDLCDQWGRRRDHGRA